MKNAAESGERLDSSRTEALLRLCEGMLLVWTRHIATARAQSESAVAEMLSAFAGLLPLINEAGQHSSPIHVRVPQQSMACATGVLSQCEQSLTSTLAQSSLGHVSKPVVESALQAIRTAITTLDSVHSLSEGAASALAQQVEQMYKGFQYQDRISQNMRLVETDMAELHAVLNNPAATAPVLAAWLEKLESQYAMAEQHNDHLGGTGDHSPPSGENETTFF